MMKRLIILIIYVVLLFNCNKKEDSFNPVDPGPGIDTQMIDESYYKAFSMIDPYQEILHDSINNLIYVADRRGGQIKSYDYKSNKVKSITLKNTFIERYEMALYSELNFSELYIGNRNSIYIYEGSTLTLIDSIQVFDSNNDNRYITSIQAPNEDILIIGACNSSSFDKRGSIVLSKKSKSIINQAKYGGNCLRLRSFINQNTFIEVVGVGYATSRPEIISDIYTIEGELIENRIEYFPQGETSLHLLKTNGVVDYFITSGEGSIYSKTSLELLGSLNGNYIDIILNASGNKLYCLSNNKTLEVIDYPSLNIEENIPLPSNPVRGFIDENKMIIISFKRELSRDSTEIYLTKIDI